MVELRLDPRLRARLDASDILPKALLDAARDLKQLKEMLATMSGGWGVL